MFNYNQNQQAHQENSHFPKEFQLSIPEKWSTTIKTQTRVIPQLYLQDSNFICNGHFINLRTRPSMTKLFEVFFHNQTNPLNREDIITAVYGPIPRHASERMLLSTHQKAIKLLSRARELANRAVNTNSYSWIEWFAYDKTLKKYHFYHLTQRYIFDTRTSVGPGSALFHTYPDTPVSKKDNHL